MTSTSFRDLIKPIEAVGNFISSIGGEDSEDDDVCEKCEREKSKNSVRRHASTSKRDKVSQLRESVKLHKPHGDEANNALRHAKLGRALHARFELHGDPHDLDEAIAHISTAASLLPPKHKHRPMYESNVGLLLCVRYEHTHLDKDLDRAVTYCRNALTALDALPSSSSSAAIDKAWYRANLATGLLHRYEKFKQPQNLEESLTLWRTAISALPEDHPDKASYQSNLSAVYLARHQLNGNMEDLDRSIQAIRAAIKGTPQSDIHWVVYKYMASSLYLRRWNKTQKPEDIDKAIEAGRAALAGLPTKHRYSSRYQSELATKLISRFDQSGNLDDVNEAINLSKDAAVTFAHAAYPAERTTTPANRLVALSQALSKRFEKTENMSDLDDAIKHARQAATIADKSRSAERHVIHAHLSNLIYSRFERTGALEDLDDSIAHSCIAVDATPGSKSQKDREELAERLSTLSSHYLTRFEFQRNNADLDGAVNYAKTALDLKKAGDGDGPLNLDAHPAARYALGLALFRRFEQSGDIKDLDGALKNAQLAFDAVNLPPAPVNRRASLSSSRSRPTTGTSSTATVTAGNEADSRKILYESLLSGVLCARYKRLGERADLDGAIAHAEAILKATPPDHPLYEMYKSIHSFALLASPVEETRIAPDDIIQHAREEAERAQMSGDPNWGKAVLRLCNLLYGRYERNLDARTNNTQNEGDLDLENALADWKKVATASMRSLATPPSVRLRAALKWADTCCREGRYKGAVEAYKVAMTLAPRTSLARHKGALEDDGSMADPAIGEENELLLNTFSLASDVAASAITRGQLEAAIEFLEQARSLLWRDALGLPSELDYLERVNPALVQHLTDLLIEQEHSSAAGPLVTPIKPTMRAPWMSGSGGAYGSHSHAYGHGHDKSKVEETLDDRWNSLVHTVRAAEPGFENFLRPWSLDTMRHEGAIVPVGPVVILNSSYLRCDAIILISTSEPVLVPLPDVVKTGLERLAAQIVTGVKDLGEGSASGFEFDKGVLEPVLKELWEKVVRPIMLKLEEVGAGAGRNIGWVPSGAFTWLPLHAAAALGDNIYKQRDRDVITEDGESVLQLRNEYWTKYTSYYATTLQSLLRPPVIHNETSSRILVISDQPSRRASLLGGIGTSVQAVKTHFSNRNSNGSNDGGSGKEETPVPSNVQLESLEGPSQAKPDTIFQSLHSAHSTHHSKHGDFEGVRNGVDAVHLSCPVHCDALRPSSSNWRVGDGGSIRLSDLFNSWFYPESFSNPTVLPDFVFSSTTSYRVEGPTRLGDPAENKISLPQELMLPEAALHFAGVRAVIGQIWSAKSEDSATIAKHLYNSVKSGGVGEERKIFANPVTGKLSRNKPGNGNESGAEALSHNAHGSTLSWETKGVEDGLAALRTAQVPLFRTVPFVRYGP